jgi:hypothetical protein
VRVTVEQLICLLRVGTPVGRLESWVCRELGLQLASSEVEGCRVETKVVSGEGNIAEASRAL